jgi:formate/nitrite transporter
MAADNPGLQRMLMGIFGLPTFLTMTIVTGAELFTGNTALVTMAVLEGKANWGQLMKSWCVSYLGNIIGCAAVVTLFFHSGIFATATAPITVATYKATLPLGQALLRSIGCNWLVCMAVWQATGATSFPGKFLSCLLPISAFVALGLEHSIANMFIIPLGIMLGAPISFSDFLMNNLIPVTLGNTIAGVLFVGVAFCYAYGKLGKGKAATA